MTFALGVYGGEYRLSDIGLRIKKTLGEKAISARLVNTENQNIVSAVWKREKLGRSKSEYNLIHIKGTSYLGVTIACQDIDAYAKRDTGKSRDMVVGMMPPKLAQMMINFATQNGSSGKLKVESSTEKKLIHLRTGEPVTLYDPFCGLGTILIEGANMGITKIYGSDISERMVESSRKSLASFIEEEKMWQERIRIAGGTPAKDFSEFESDIFELDASKIGNTPSLLGEGWSEGIIVSEGYLGEIMKKETITENRIREEKAKLSIMYDGFFGGLARLDFSGTIVMTFPCWEIHGVSYPFHEIYDVIGRHGWDIILLLPTTMRTMMTPKGSLIYRRPDQTVGREVVKIQKK